MPEFHVDQRVTSRHYGNGTVVSIAALDRGIIGVRRDGCLNPERYHPSVWAPTTQASAPSVSLTFSRYSKVVSVPAADFHREQTRLLGAQQGERHPFRRQHEAAAWSAHLRFLVNQSARRDAECAPSVGWDPYGDDL